MPGRLPPRFSTARTSFAVAQLAVWSMYGALSIISVLPYVGLSAHLPSVWACVLRRGGFALAALAGTTLLARFVRRTPLPFLAALSAATGIVATAFGNAIPLVLGALPEVEADWRSLFAGSITGAVVVLLWTACALAIFRERELGKAREQALLADGLAKEAQLQMLRYQIDPHFIFNTLNSVHALLETDPPAAGNMLTQLGDFLRQSLRHPQRAVSSLSEEFDAIRAYLAIEKVRFDDRLEIAVELPPGAEALVVPSFLTHPLVENAVRYGMMTSARPLRVRVAARLEGGRLGISVENSGSWSDDARKGAGIGLDNVRARLLAAFGEAGRLEHTTAGGWVSARITLPVAS